MTQLQHLCPLIIGQPQEAAPELVGAIAASLNDDKLASVAKQVAEAMIDLIQLAGAQSFIQLTLAQCQKTGEQPVTVLERALSNAQSELENAKAELERSNRRLAAHRQAFQ